MTRNKAEGQSALEFVLIAPILFFIFFAIIQLFYTACLSFAAQRAAFAIARESSLTGIRTGPRLRFIETYNLAPLAALSRESLVGILAAQYSCRISPDGKRVFAQVKVPLPIWVPMVGKIFGEKLNLSSLSHSRGEEASVRSALTLLNISFPDMTRNQFHLPYFFWLDFESSTHNEGGIQGPTP